MRPFSYLPPFLADWSRIGDGTVFQDLEPLVFPVTWSDMTHAAEAYIAALTYDFKVILGFIEQKDQRRCTGHPHGRSPTERPNHSPRTSAVRSRAPNQS